MPCSTAKLAANQANSRKSTGPKTVEGKLRSRANAIKHGLCASVVVAEDPKLLKERYSDWFYSIHPQNEFQRWMVEKASVSSVRIDRAERMERQLRDRNSLKAELAWDDDRRIEAEALGQTLGSSPSEVAEKLRRTPAGCDWLIRRWELLALAAESGNNAWTAEQTSLAFDLLGTPAEFRPGQSLGVAPDPDDNAGLARSQVLELLEHREAVADLDEVDRSLTINDLFDETHPELKRLRRYEGTLHNRLRWCLAQARLEESNYKSPPELCPIWKAETAPAIEPGLVASGKSESTLKAEEKADARPMTLARRLNLPPAPNPPFDLTLDELPRDGSKPDLMKILLNRHEKREEQAERRREARRRKAEKLRA